MIYYNLFFVQVCITFTWLYSGVMMLPELITENGFVLEGILTSCSFNYLSQEFKSRIYMFILFIGGFAIPFLTICFFYFLLFLELKTKQQQLKILSLKLKIIRKVTFKLNSKSEIFSDLIIEAKSENQDENKKINKNKNFASFLYKREIHVARNSILIISLFCMAWTPYATVTLLAQFGTNIENYVNPYSTSLTAIFAKLPAITDPLVYTLSNKSCRHYFKTIFKKTFHSKCKKFK